MGVSEPEAALRNNAPLSKDRTEEILRDTEERYREVQSDWSGWRANLPKWTNSYRCFVKAKTDPWPGCSNLSLPIDTIATEQMHSTMLGLLGDPENLIRVNPTDYGDIRQARTIQRFANHAFFHEMDLVPAFDRLMHKICRHGMAGGVLRWNKDLRKTRERWPVLVSELNGKRDAASVAAYFYQDRLLSARPAGKGTVKCRFLDDEAMKERDSTLMLVPDEDRQDPRDDELEFEVSALKLMRDCPVLDIPAVDDLLFSADGKTPNDASMHFYTLWQTLDQLQSYKRSGYYNIDSELMHDLVTDFNSQHTANEEGISGPSRAHDESYSTVSVSSAMRRTQFEVVKAFRFYDIDDDNELEEVIFTILIDARGIKHLLRWDYLERQFPHGKRPFIFGEFIYLDDIPVAMGIPEFMSGIKAELNTLFNQGNDANSVRNNPWFAYDPGSALVPSSVRVRPGQGIPATPGSIWMPSFNNSSGSDVQTMAFLMSMGERMMPNGDVATGRGSGGNRTAGGLAMLQQASQVTWDKYVKRAGRTIENACSQAIGLYAAFMPPWKEIRIAGTQEIVKLERRALRGGYDFTVRASALASNKEIERAYALQRFQLLSQHPFYQSEEKQWVLIRDLLESQEVKNIPEHLGPEPTATRHPYLEQRVENALFIQGIPWEPHADEDHKQHLAELQEFLMSPASKYGNATALALMHKQMHERFLTTMQRQAQQQAMGVPMDGAVPGADFGQMGGMNPLMNSLQQQPGAMLEAAGGGV